MDSLALLKSQQEWFSTSSEADSKSWENHWQVWQYRWCITQRKKVVVDFLKHTTLWLTDLSSAQGHTSDYLFHLCFDAKFQLLFSQNESIFFCFYHYSAISVDGPSSANSSIHWRGISQIKAEQLVGGSCIIGSLVVMLQF